MQRFCLKSFLSDYPICRLAVLGLRDCCPGKSTIPVFLQGHNSSLPSKPKRCFSKPIFCNWSELQLQLKFAAWSEPSCSAARLRPSCSVPRMQLGSSQAALQLGSVSSCSAAWVKCSLAQPKLACASDAAWARSSCSAAWSRSS